MDIISVSCTVGFCFVFFFFSPGGLCNHGILLFHTCKKTQGQVQGVFLGQLLAITIEMSRMCKHFYSCTEIPLALLSFALVIYGACKS